MVALATTCEECGTELRLDEKAGVKFCPTCDPERAARIETEMEEEAT